MKGNPTIPQQFDKALSEEKLENQLKYHSVVNLSVQKCR